MCFQSLAICTAPCGCLLHWLQGSTVFQLQHPRQGMLQPSVLLVLMATRLHCRHMLKLLVRTGSIFCRPACTKAGVWLLFGQKLPSGFETTAAFEVSKILDVLKYPNSILDYSLSKFLLL